MMSGDMPMSLADMWNKALMKRPAPAHTPMPQAQRLPVAKKQRSGSGDAQMSEHTLLDAALDEMSDDGVDQALRELLQEEHPDKARTRGACGLPVCCVGQRKAPALAPARSNPPSRKASLPAPNGHAPNGMNGAKPHVINGAPPDGAPPKGEGEDDSPNSVMRMLYPNLFH